VIQVKEGNLLTFQAAGNVTESLPRPAFGIGRNRHATIGTNDHTFVFRDNTDKFNSQQIKDIIR
jgi:hypothetical protein